MIKLVEFAIKVNKKRNINLKEKSLNEFDNLPLCFVL